ncbi:cupin domain-containing protein [Candidatus Fermentibacterales bacterium]|nr:cupin domain-containing protein [Candidatus Fermentibacterales bacterium]
MRAGILVEHEPGEQRLRSLGAADWPVWSCEESEFPWEYHASETCLLPDGDAEVFPGGSADAVRLAGGDLVTFRKGPRCVWRVLSPVRKHYGFED